MFVQLMVSFCGPLLCLCVVVVNWWLPPLRAELWFLPIKPRAPSFPPFRRNATVLEDKGEREWFVMVHRVRATRAGSYQVFVREELQHSLNFSSPFFSKSDGWYAMYETREIVFYHISKHREDSWATRSGVFFTNLVVVGNVVIHCI